MEENQIRWSVIDPLGNEIVLKESVFIDHVLGEHKTKDADIRASLEEQVKIILQSPRFIIKDRNFPNRRKYLDLVAVTVSGTNKVKTVGIIVEVEVEPFVVVTWYARRVMDEPFTNEELIYHAGFQGTSRV